MHTAYTASILEALNLCFVVFSSHLCVYRASRTLQKSCCLHCVNELQMTDISDVNFMQIVNSLSKVLFF